MVILIWFVGQVTGVSRGCGWQHLATYINFGTFYLVGMPIASILAFKLHLYSKAITTLYSIIQFCFLFQISNTIAKVCNDFCALIQGLWFGLICGLIAQSSSLFVLTRRQEWKSLKFSHGVKENSPLL